MLVSYSDEESNGQGSLVGDVVCAIAAAFYSVYSVTLKFWVGSDERLNMPMFFGSW